jgi:hypothetical protein
MGSKNGCRAAGIVPDVSMSGLMFNNTRLTFLTKQFLNKSLKKNKKEGGELPLGGTISPIVRYVIF